jgi:hypothetical protein
MKANSDMKMGKAFEQYLLKIGSGAKEVKIAPDLCVWNQEALIDFVFPSLKNESTVEVAENCRILHPPENCRKLQKIAENCRKLQKIGGAGGDSALMPVSCRGEDGR